MLRTWEAEFPDLGFAKTQSGPRVYRRADVEKVLRIKHLLFVDGLTLAGVRKQMSAEGAAPVAEDVNDADVAALLDEDTRRQLQDVRRGLQWILGVLSGDGVTPEDFVLRAPAANGSSRSGDRRPAPTKKAATKKPASRAAKPQKKAAKAKRR